MKASQAVELDAVRAFLLTHYRWRTLAEISEATGIPEASVSAWLRDLRKGEFHRDTIERRLRSRRTLEYRMLRPCVMIDK